MPKRNKEIERSTLAVEIAGGLGNQLFMLYGGLYFGKHLNREVRYNTLELSRMSRLHPGLNLQSLGLINKEETEVRTRAWLQRVSWKLKKYTKLKFSSFVFVAKEIGYVAPQSVPSETRFLRGYFQSWKYYEYLSEKPILNIDCIPSPSDWFRKMKKEVETAAPVVLHVRRGDYGLSENRFIGLLSTKYYERALSFLDPSKPIWVFSDSPELVENELQCIDRELVFIKPPKESDPVESLLLMSLASEIVISNSTFSWWAAFLSGKNARILAPSKWYELQPDPVDLIPDKWERIESSWLQ